jgi:WD40-like Beta Propeller Repeat
MGGQRLIVVAPLAGAAWLAAADGRLTTVAQRDDRRCAIDVATVAVSASGGHVAFASSARLVPADTDDAYDIYVLDRSSGRVTLESGEPGGGVAAADSIHPAINGDGRFVVYQTAVTTRDRPAFAIPLRDRAQDVTTILATGPPSGWGGAPIISADGRFVAFVSASTDLVTGGDANGSGDDVYMVDVASRRIERVSVDGDGRQPATGASFAPALSADGRRIAFTSTAGFGGRHAPMAGALLARRPYRLPQVYVRDRVDGTTRLVSVAPDGTGADGHSWKASIDGAGRHVAFVSTATTLSREDRVRGADVFVADLVTGAIGLISRSARGGGGNGPSANPALSADGRFVAFQLEASDLVCAGTCAAGKEDINLLPDVFLFDRRSGTAARLSGGESGGWLEPSVGPALDGSGTVVAFSSRHPIDAADTRNDYDLFILSRDPAGAVARVASPIRQPGQPGGRAVPRRHPDAQSVGAWGPLLPPPRGLRISRSRNHLR